MDSKNRFAKLMEELASKAEIKNYVLASAVQYDVSYISKWLSGKLIPGEKVAPKVISKLSHCIVTQASEAGLAQILWDYQLEDPILLEHAIIEHLTAEYNYVKDYMQQKNSTSDTGIQFFPELNFTQYLKQLQHPILRRMNSLNIITMIDLKSLSYDNRSLFLKQIVEAQGIHHISSNISFSLIIDHRKIESVEALEEIVSLMKLLISGMHINLDIYRNPKTYGRVMLVVENEFFSSGMIDDGNKCVSVLTTESPSYCNKSYNNLKVMLKDSMKMFYSMNACDLFSNSDYLHTSMAENQSWLLGHVCEVLLTESIVNRLFHRLVEIHPELTSLEDDIRTAKKISRMVLYQNNIRIILCDSVFSYLVFSDEIDFYGYRVKINREEKLEILHACQVLVESNENMNLRMAFSPLDTQFYIPNQSLLIYDRTTYMRLNNNSHQSKIYRTDQNDVHQTIQDAFDYIWHEKNHLLTDDKQHIIHHIQKIIQMI